jgi:DNA transformation protein and related proteins
LSSSFVAHVVDDLLEGFGARAKAMFGGWGLYKGGRMFAIVVDDALYFKVSPQNRRDFEAAGSRPFTYRAKNRKDPVVLSFWEVPARVMDDREAIAEWAAKAHQAAGDAHAKRRK